MLKYLYISTYRNINIYKYKTETYFDIIIKEIKFTMRHQKIVKNIIK